MTAADESLSSPGDQLLAALSTWGRADRKHFRHAYDAIAAARPPGPVGPHDEKPGPTAMPVRWARAAAARGLAALGHCILGPDGSLAVLPPGLALLPTAGPPQAVLTGSRTPESARTFLRCAAAAGADTRADSQHHASPLAAPSRIWVQAPTLDALAEIAEQTGAALSAGPASWAALNSDRRTVDTITQSLGWKRQRELGWDRRDFDAARLQFGPPGAAASYRYRLSGYLSPSTQQPLHRLNRIRAGEPESADIDVDWGRYIAADSGKRTSHITYSALARTAAVPVTMPLPASLARALSLCSGWHPQPMPALTQGQPDQLAYRGVPPDIWRELKRRLGVP